ncbi:hypothetical protein LDDCCGHA_1982 [Methylobacterium oxalidis]|nr:hypothetical protein LDDCCGHA_1982 [Methylobacterium oxalidis]
MRSRESGSATLLTDILLSVLLLGIFATGFTLVSLGY